MANTSRRGGLWLARTLEQLVLAKQQRNSIEQLVHQLMLLDQQAQRTRRAAGHRAR